MKDTTQNLKNHASFDPWFHLFLALVLLFNAIHALILLIRHPNFNASWNLVLAFALMVAWVKIRTYPLRVQDRVIRVEERIRLRELAPAEGPALVALLTEDQLIGLRFAPDEEAVELAHQAITEKLNRKQIKERIKVWRADYWRI